MDRTIATESQGSKKAVSCAVPPEYLRKVFREQHDKVQQPSSKDNTRYVLAMRYLPRAILKLWETIPMPWEAERTVRVTFHINGYLTYVTDIPYVYEPAYVALWAVMWLNMRKEKSLRMNFIRLKMNPIFDDDEPPVNFSDALMDAVLHSPIDFGGESEEQSVLEKFAHAWETQQLDSITQHERSILCRLSRVLLSDATDSNSRYMFDENTFVTAKTQNTVIPGGPRYMPPATVSADPELSEFNDCQKTIYRQPVKPQHPVAYPNLYNAQAEYSASSVLHEPALCYLRSSDPDLPTFTFDPLIHPIPMCVSEESVHECAPIAFKPFLEDLPLSDTNTSDGLEVYWSRSYFVEKVAKRKSAVDIPLVSEWFFEKCPAGNPIKVRVSCQKLLKHRVKNYLRRQKARERGNIERVHTPGVLPKGMEHSKFFKSTRIDWVEAGLQLCTQAHDMLTLYLRRRNIDFIHLDYNFNLKPKKALTTRERKRSRFGPAFHLIRELLKVTKMLVDAHVKHRLGEIDAYQLADAVHYIFTHVGKLSGIYRYKYTFMRRIKHSKDLKHLLYHRFNSGPVGKGPGMGFWAPVWRMWVCLFRGMMPLLEKFINRLIDREIDGRNQKSVVKKITKQRSESTYDREMRMAIIRELNDIIPENLRAKKVPLILQHFSEAWRRWKSNVPVESPGLPASVQALILRFVKQKAEWWTSTAHFNRKRIANGQAIDKATVRKNHGRLVRLQIKEEQDRQRDWIERGPFLAMDDFANLYTTFAKWLSTQQFQQIPFPPVAYKHDMKILRIALEKLRENHGAPGSRTTSAARHEQLKIEEAFNNPQTTINGIKRKLMQMRAFKTAGIEYVDYFTHMHPVYEVDVDEKIVDAYLYQYLAYEAERRGLFPSWIKPKDDLPNPARLYNWCNTLNSLDKVWDTSRGERTVYVETQLHNLAENMEGSLLNEMLRLVVDRSIADYMLARNNIEIAYKDMRYTNSYGLVRGLLFSPFVYQLWGLLMDLSILGLSRADELHNARSSRPSTHPIQMYMRYLDKVHIVYRLSNQQAVDTINSSGSNAVSIAPSFSIKTCWPRQMRSRYVTEDTKLANALFVSLKERIPSTLIGLERGTTFISVYSRRNPLLLFGMNGFELCIKPRCRTRASVDTSDDQNVWNLIDAKTRTLTAQAFLRVSPKEVQNFEIRIRLVLLNSGQTPFKKLVEKWNTQLSSLVVYYREAIYGTHELLRLIKRCETKIQNRVKVQLNSKMPKRFPPVVFYAPVDLWGLGMLSIGHSYVPTNDDKGENTTHFRAGVNQTGIEIPNVLRYVTPWQDEMRESVRVWTDYKEKAEEAMRANKRIILDDIQEMRGLGIPRIATAFQADRAALLYDIGWRVAQEFKVHNVQRPQPFWFTNNRHDGKLFSFDKYKADVVQAFGGIEAILAHSIFPATGYASWDGLDWNRISKFEETMQARKITNAQRGGLSKIPNQRFTLWWSPTLNRSSVYVGFLTQIDMTGVFLHAKLPLLKMSLAQVFQNHLWPKIHEGLVVDICRSLQSSTDKLGLEEVEQSIASYRKSFRMSSGAADIRMRSAKPFDIAMPSGLEEQDFTETITQSDTFWIDVQLRWGDFDANDVDKYVRSMFLSYTTDQGDSKYPSPTGVIIAFDLAYNTYAAFGFWFRGLKAFIRKVLIKVKQHNTELYRFRSTLNSKLQLAPMERAEPPLNAQNFDDLFARKTVWLLEGSCIKLSSSQRTTNGFVTSKPLNGAVFVINPSSGNLYVMIVHAEVWRGQKRLSVLVKTKVAESCATLIRSLPKDDHPKLIVTMQRQILEPVNGALAGLTSTVIKGSQLLIPLKALVKVPRLYSLMQSANSSQTHLVQLYDDWLEHVSHVTALFRLIIILRALNVNEYRAKKILELNDETRVASHHLWPSLSPEGWLAAETKLKDLIIADYCRRNSVDVSRITPTEVRDILFGQEMLAGEAAQQRDASIDKAQQNLEEASADLEQSVRTDADERKEAEGKLENVSWRDDLIAARHRSSLPIVFPQPAYLEDNACEFAIPRNTFSMMARCAGLPHRTVAVLYGKQTRDRTYSVLCALFPPQSAVRNVLRFAQRLPHDDILSVLKPIGLLVTATDSYIKVPEADVRLATAFVRTNAQYFGSDRPFLYVRMFEQGGCWSFGSFQADTKGIAEEVDANVADEDIQPLIFQHASVRTTRPASCFFYTTPDGIWNRVFTSGPVTHNMSYKVKVANPVHYHHPTQRPQHFSMYQAM